MFSMLLNTCAIPDGFVTFGESSAKCSKCRGYTNQAVYYPPPSSMSSNMSPGQSIKVENISSSSNHRLSSSGLPDIVVSHTTNSVARSVSHLGRDNQEETTQRERRTSPASFRRFSQAPISRRSSTARPDNAISRIQCQSLSRRKDFRASLEEERIGISWIGLESTCLESCCNDGPSPPAVNQIDYVNVGFNLRLIADSFQSTSTTSRTLRSGKMKLIVREKLSSNLYIKCFCIGLLGFVVLTIMRSS